MKLKDFEKFVKNNSRVPLTFNNYVYAFVGLAGEAGECMEWLKKTRLRPNPTTLTEEDLKNELGDVIHYVQRICIHHGWSLKDVMEANVEKLEERYGKTL